MSPRRILMIKNASQTGLCTRAKFLISWLMFMPNGGYTPTIERAESFTSVPEYIPGMMLIRIPEAGWGFDRVDIGFWAYIQYLVGSTAYLLDSIFSCFFPEHDQYSYLNLFAAVTFVLNALFCFVDWYLQLNQLGAMNMYIDETVSGKVFLSRIPDNLSAYYFYNNVFFMSAALVYLFQALYPVYTELYMGSFWVTFWGSLLYLCSASFSLLEFFENTRLRRLDHLPDLKLFTCNSHEIDWFGWGDVLYVQLSLFLFVAVFIDASPVMANVLYFLESVLFLLNSLSYFIGYVVYMYDLQNAMKVSLKHALDNQHLLSENSVEMTECSSSPRSSRSPQNKTLTLQSPTITQETNTTDNETAQTPRKLSQFSSRIRGFLTPSNSLVSLPSDMNLSGKYAKRRSNRTSYAGHGGHGFDSQSALTPTESTPMTSFGDFASFYQTNTNNNSFVNNNNNNTNSPYRPYSVSPAPPVERSDSQRKLWHSLNITLNGSRGVGKTDSGKYQQLHVIQHIQSEHDEQSDLSVTENNNTDDTQFVDIECEQTPVIKTPIAGRYVRQ